MEAFEYTSAPGKRSVIGPSLPQTIWTVNEDDLYREASATYGPALERLVYAYEANSGKRADLLQEIHIALWR